MNRRLLASWALLSTGAWLGCASPIVDDSGADDSSADVTGSGGATGGAAGSGGAPLGTGGSPVATGGSATGGTPSATGGSSACGGGISTPENFQAELKIDSNTDQSAYVNGELHITNIGPAIDPTGLKIRYYFTSEVPNKSITVRWANTAGFTGATASIVPMQAAEATATADYYIEFVPTGANFSGTGVISYQMQADNAASDKFTQSNDYSWNAAATTKTPTDKIVILQGDTVVWGVPPC